jgi:hypothetical protein
MRWRVRRERRGRSGARLRAGDRRPLGAARAARGGRRGGAHGAGRLLQLGRAGRMVGQPHLPDGARAGRLDRGEPATRDRPRSHPRLARLRPRRRAMARDRAGRPSAPCRRPGGGRPTPRSRRGSRRVGVRGRGQGAASQDGSRRRAEPPAAAGARSFQPLGRAAVRRPSGRRGRRGHQGGKPGPARRCARHARFFRAAERGQGVACAGFHSSGGPNAPGGRDRDG